MKIPNEVVWQLTKKWNSSLLKSNGQQFSRDPLNLTGLHNASSVNGPLGLSAVNQKDKKGLKRVVTLLQKHKQHNKINKKANSTSGLLASSVVLKKGINRIGKVVKGLQGVSERTRKQALRRLARLHVATRPHVKGATAKKEEKK
jgi:hypothetical protein